MRRLNRSPKVSAVIYIALFALMLCCNVLTLKMADDYAYCYSWANGQRITSIADILPSMAAHARSMNGRLISHALAQFFLMLPDWVFDVVNAGMFVL